MDIVLISSIVVILLTFAVPVYALWYCNKRFTKEENTKKVD